MILWLTLLQACGTRITQVPDHKHVWDRAAFRGHAQSLRHKASPFNGTYCESHKRMVEQAISDNDSLYDCPSERNNSRISTKNQKLN